MVGIIEAAKGDIVVAILIIFTVSLVGLMVWIYKKVITFVLDSLKNQISRLCKESEVNTQLNQDSIKIARDNLKVANKTLDALIEITRTQEEIRKELNGRSSLGSRLSELEKKVQSVSQSLGRDLNGDKK